MRFLKAFFLLLGIYYGLSTAAHAQRSFPQPYSRSTAELADRFPHIIKVNFLSPFVLTANVAYEHFINPKVSIQLGAYYNGITLNDTDFYWFNLPRARYRSFAITPEVRYYTGSAARTKLNGFYLAPFLRYQNTSIQITPEQQDPDDQSFPLQENYEGNLHSVRIGAVAGYKFIVGNHLSLEIFAGPNIRATHWLNANVETYEAERFLPFGFLLRSGMTIGYAF
jgi:hypothetical protein